MDRIKCKAVSQMSMQDDINLPEASPDLSKIIFREGNVVLSDVKVSKDHVTLGGTLEVFLLYLTEDDNEELARIDGKIPFYTDDDLTAYFKKLTFPADCAQTYWDWYHTDYQDNGTDPILLLFEALKWTFRLGCHIAITHKGM